MLKKVSFEGVEICYRQIGSCNPNLPTILLLHGACQDMTTWESQYNFLSSYTRFNSIALDLPGHGMSGGNAFTSIEQNSEFLYSLVNKLDLKEIILMGHSMGGRIAQLFCLDHPALTAGCILAATGTRIRITKATFNILRNDYDEFCKMATKNSFSESTNKNIKEAFFNRLISSNKETCINDMIACDKFDVSRNINRIHIPVLIIAGDADILAPVRYSRELYIKTRDSKLVIMKGTGHFMMIEEPSVFNSILKNFLDFL